MIMNIVVDDIVVVVVDDGVMMMTIIMMTMRITIHWLWPQTVDQVIMWVARLDTAAHLIGCLLSSSFTNIYHSPFNIYHSPLNIYNSPFNSFHDSQIKKKKNTFAAMFFAWWTGWRSKAQEARAEPDWPIPWDFVTIITIVIIVIIIDWVMFRHRYHVAGDKQWSYCGQSFNDMFSIFDKTEH